MKFILVLLLGLLNAGCSRLPRERQSDKERVTYRKEQCELDSVLIKEPKVKKFYENFLKLYYETLILSKTYKDADKERKKLLLNEVNKYRIVMSTPQGELQGIDIVKVEWLNTLRGMNDRELKAMLKKLHDGDLYYIREMPDDGEYDDDEELRAYQFIREEM